MILVQNHRQLLSGNKALAFMLFFWILGACSPKIQKPAKPAQEPGLEKKDNKQVEEEKKKVPSEESQLAKISLILPFEVHKLDLSASATRSGLSKADLAIDYYQGFKMALDSLTASGYNFKLQVFDSKDDRLKLQSLAFNPQVRLSDLIVGPVFPDEIKSFSAVSGAANKPLVSPLSPASPSEYKNENLITIIPPLEYHSYGAAEFVKKKLNPQKVFILKSGYNDDNKYSIPFKTAIDSLGKKTIAIVEKTITKGNLADIIPQFSTSSENVIIIPSDKQAFLQMIIRSLDDISSEFPITVIGHPSWAKASYLRAEVLQKLKTRITSSDNVDYKDPLTINFINNYRKAFEYTPGEYAIKGFDEGWYFGKLLASDPQALKNLNRFSLQLLHNKFDFIKTSNGGWVNRHVYIMKYEDFELKAEK